MQDMRFPALQIERGIHAINIFLVQLFPEELDAFSKALEVDYLPFPKKLYYISDIRVVDKAKDVVIGQPRLLLWCNCISATFIRNSSEFQ